MATRRWGPCRAVHGRGRVCSCVTLLAGVGVIGVTVEDARGRAWAPWRRLKVSTLTWRRVGTLAWGRDELNGMPLCGRLATALRRASSRRMAPAREPIPPAGQVLPPPPPPPSRQDVKTVHWHPQGEVLVSASYDDSIKLWAEEDDEWICTQTLAGKCAGSQAACLGNQRLVCAHAPAGEVFGTFADGWRASGPCSTRPRGGGACLAATCCSCLLPLRSPDALPAWQVMRTGPSSVAGRCTYDRSRPPL